MMKRLLMGAFAALMTVSTFAVEDGDYVYTPQGRFKIQGDDVMTNGKFASDLSGWEAKTATAGTTVDQIFKINSDGPNGLNCISSLTAAFTEGMYYMFMPESSSDSYVVSVKIKGGNAAKTSLSVGDALGSRSILKETRGGNGYASGVFDVYGNEDADPTKITNSAIGYGIETTNEWQEYNFAIEGTGTDLAWFIEIGGMQSAIQIADIQIHKAVKVYDLQKAAGVINMAKDLMAINDWAAEESMTADQQAVIAAIKKNIDNFDKAGEAVTVALGEEYFADLNTNLTKFLNDKAVFEDFLASCSKNTVWNGVARGATAAGDWTSFDRLRNDEADFDYTTTQTLKIGYYSGSQANLNTQNAWNNFQMKKNLKAGYYVLAVDAAAVKFWHKNALTNGNDWTRGPWQPVQIKVFINDQETEAQWMTPGSYNTYDTYYIVVKLEQDVDDATLGFSYFIDTNMTQSINMVNPRIYYKSTGKYNAAQVKYIEDVQAQIKAFRDEYDRAQVLVANEDGKNYWHKQAVTDRAELLKPYLDMLEGLDEDAIIAGFEDPFSAAAYGEYEGYCNNLGYDNYAAGLGNAVDSIMKNGVRAMKAQNDALVDYNKRFVTYADVIATAKKTAENRAYAMGDATGLNNAIEAAEEFLEEYKQEDPSEEEIADMVAQFDEDIQNLNNSINEFIAGVPAGISVIDIDFNDENAFTYEPGDPVFVQDGAASYTFGPGQYVGTKGTMTFGRFSMETPPNDTKGSKGTWDMFKGGMPFENGYTVDGERQNAGILRVGAAEGKVVIPEEDRVGGSNILHLSFDTWSPKAIEYNFGFYLNDADGKSVGSLYYLKSKGTVTVNDFNIDLGKIAWAGSDNGVGDDAKTHYDFYYDYGAKTMYAVLNGASAKNYVTAEVALGSDKPAAEFIIKSDGSSSKYTYTGRRSWFDNLKMEMIEAGQTGVVTVKNVNDLVQQNRVVAGADGLYIIKANGEKVTLAGAAK